MMEQNLFEHLRDNVTSVGGRVSPLIMPQDCEKPALVYTVIYDGDNQGAEGCVGSYTTRVQIDVYSYSYIEAKSIKNEVKAALYTFEHYPLTLNVMDGFEENQELFRQIIDFTYRRT